LALRIRDLSLAIEGSWIEERVNALHAELTARGITAFRPHCYLGDEWFSPEDVPAISIPFYLAHPRLMALERKEMLEVEGGDPVTFQRLLRHECGHAIEHAYRLHLRRKRKALFGPRTAAYDPDTYRPRPYSRSYVRNLPKWYAQAHPDEDFAETFAVWLDPTVNWRQQYAGWRALAKLEYVDETMREIGATPPKVVGGKLECEASKLRLTLERFYRQRRTQYAEDLPDFYDRDLRRLFDGASTPGDGPKVKASAFMRKRRKLLIESVSRWTGEHKVTIQLLLKKLMERAQALSLTLATDEERTGLELTAYLATLVSHYRFTGKFKRSV
jgi:hypothetical protein